VPELLIGRDREVALVDGALALARSGGSSVLVLRGEPGIGKTALLRYAASQAAGMRVLAVTGVESESRLAFAGLHALFHGLDRELALIPGRQASAVRAAIGTENWPADPAADWLAVAAGTHTLLTMIAEREPVLVLVDDLHWLDSESLHALTFAMRRLNGDALACVTATRPVAHRLDGLTVDDLAGLDRAESARLIERLTGQAPAPSVAARLHAETGGNPLALTEFATTPAPGLQLVSNGPDVLLPPLPLGAGVRERFAVRLAGLAEPDRICVLVAAAAGRCPSTTVLTAAGRLGGSPTLETAELARLVAVGSDGVEFAHPLIRSVAYHDCPAPLRRAAHQVLADVLAATDPERAAWHLAAAATGPDEVAAGALESAARLAAAKGAFAAASAAWEQAGVLTADPRLSIGRLVASAEAALCGGDFDRAARIAAMPTAEIAVPQLARLLAVRGRLDVLSGQMASAQRGLSEAAELLVVSEPATAADLLAQAVDAGLEAGLVADAGRAADRLAALAADGLTAPATAELRMALVAWHRGEADRAADLMRSALARFTSDGAVAASPEHQLEAADALMATGHPDLASDHAERAVELARDSRALGGLAAALNTAGRYHLEAGRWSRALARASQALDLAREAGHQYLACDALITMAAVEAAQGREESCRAHAREAEQICHDLALPRRLLLARRQVLLLELGLGRLDEAIACGEQMRIFAEELGLRHPYYSPLADLAEVYVRAGDLGRAQELATEFSGMTSGTDNALPAGRIARLRGLLMPEGFDEAFEQAISLQRRVSFQLARTRLCYGERLRRVRRRADAKVHLRQAAEIFTQLDARPWAERAASELRAAGETGEPVMAAREQLTPQELQIALLVAEGRTNKQVAHAIFLSTRTVEFHLSRVYRKLGVANRTELTRLMASMS